MHGLHLLQMFCGVVWHPWDLRLTKSFPFWFRGQNLGFNCSGSRSLNTGIFYVSLMIAKEKQTSSKRAQLIPFGIPTSHSVFKHDK